GPRARLRVSLALAAYAPSPRDGASDPRWEPYAGKPHVRICAGGGEQSSSLPRPPGRALVRYEDFRAFAHAVVTFPKGGQRGQRRGGGKPQTGERGPCAFAHPCMGNQLSSQFSRASVFTLIFRMASGCLVSFFVRPEGRFSVPTCRRNDAARSRCQGWPSREPVTRSALAGHP